MPELRDRILTAIAEEPPANLADGGTIRSGYHAELDELRDISRNSRQYIAQIETRERSRTRIQSLKVRFNNVFGYYIEISKANLHLAPSDYERKQTLVNAETIHHAGTQGTGKQGSGRRGENARARA